MSIKLGPKTILTLTAASEREKQIQITHGGSGTMQAALLAAVYRTVDWQKMNTKAVRRNVN
jgi:hypothetical protein